MSLYYGSSASSSAAQTHAFVVGINYYPHLIGGDGQQAGDTFGMAQLTSPVVSAKDFADWLRSKYANSIAPLGTIELLLSPSQNYNGSSIESATLQNLTARFAEWHQRCSASKDNIAVFYFCGHGLVTNTTVLLAEDFGARPLTPWDGSFDLHLTHSNLADLPASTQCFIIDACRTQISTVTPPGGIPALISRSPTAFPPRNAPIWQSSRLGQSAHGEMNRRSYFTAALIDCLDRLGPAHRINEQGSQVWIVDTYSLPRALHERMARTVNQRGHAIPLSCNTSGGEHNLPASRLHEIPDGDERVMCRIGCDPESATEHAIMSVSRGGTTVENRPLPIGDPWLPELPTGIDYDVEGQLASGAPFAHIRNQNGVWVAPPLFACDLEVR